MRIEDIWGIRVPTEEGPTPQHIVDSIKRRKNKKVKARAKGKRNKKHRQKMRRKR